MGRVLRSTIFAAGLILLQAPVQQDPEPYPGQSQHATPPDGWVCQNQNYELSVPPDHACNCERMCSSETGQMVEDKKCLVWCHSDHCTCLIGNKTACGTMPAGGDPGGAR